MENSLSEDLGELLKTEVTKGRKVRLMFQAEARFGRMVKIRRCWAPSPLRPMVDNGYEFMVMIVDGASAHGAKALVISENIRLYRLPAYSPQLNPQEHLWDELREKEFPNRVFESMAGVSTQLREGLPRLAGDQAEIKGICAWRWIEDPNLNAT